MRTYIAVMATAFIPGSPEHPSGAEAQVDLFMGDRASAQDVAFLSAMAQRWPAALVEEATATLTSMQDEDPVSFAYLREFVYHAYYSSRRTLAAMVDRGYEYHGAPQPLGYPRTEELLVPRERRGSYIPTDQVTHAQI